MTLRDLINKIKRTEIRPDPGPEVIIVKKEITPEIKDVTPAALRELLEKNLKWSQIIYEQNRRIGRKLMWAAVAGWVRFAIIVVPIIIAVILLFPIARDFWQKYQQITGSISQTSQTANNTAEQLIKLLPIDPAKQEQLKELLK